MRFVAVEGGFPLGDKGAREMKRYSLAEVLIATLALLFSAGCAKAPSSVEAADENSQQLPFDQGSGHGWFGSRSPAQVTIPAGTPLEVRMQSSVSSATASAGQEFEAVLDEPLVVNGKTVAARGADVTGRVIAARHSGRLHDPGYLRITLSSITLNGKAVPVETSSIFVQGGSHEKRDWAMIGGGTAGGALIGGLAGGGKGALIGSAIGAAGGTTAAYASGKKEVGISVERRLVFRLTQPLVTQG